MIPTQKTVTSALESRSNTLRSAVSNFPCCSQVAIAHTASITLATKRRTELNLNWALLTIVRMPGSEPTKASTFPLCQMSRSCAHYHTCLAAPPEYSYSRRTGYNHYETLLALSVLRVPRQTCDGGQRRQCSWGRRRQERRCAKSDCGSRRGGRAGPSHRSRHCREQAGRKRSDRSVPWPATTWAGVCRRACSAMRPGT